MNSTTTAELDKYVDDENQFHSMSVLRYSEWGEYVAIHNMGDKRLKLDPETTLRAP